MLKQFCIVRNNSVCVAWQSFKILNSDNTQVQIFIWTNIKMEFKRYVIVVDVIILH